MRNSNFDISDNSKSKVFIEFLTAMDLSRERYYSSISKEEANIENDISHNKTSSFILGSKAPSIKTINDNKLKVKKERKKSIKSYKDFLNILVDKVFLQCARLIKTGKYMALVVSDFRDKSDFISFHSDLIQKLNKAKIPDGGMLKLQGVKILLQNHKSLLPYGYPFSYVENIHHQYVLIFKKFKDNKK